MSFEEEYNNNARDRVTTCTTAEHVGVGWRTLKNQKEKGREIIRIHCAGWYLGSIVWAAQYNHDLQILVLFLLKVKSACTSLQRTIRDHITYLLFERTSSCSPPPRYFLFWESKKLKKRREMLQYAVTDT